MSERFDLIVIGAGPGGYVAAIRAAQLGKKVVCIDKRPALGGTCLNIGCIPSKALLDSSELYSLAQHRFARHGIQVGEVGLDLPAMLKRKDAVVKNLVDGLAYLFQKNGIQVVTGTAKLESPGRVTVQQFDGKTATLEGDAVLLATGSAPVIVPSLPYDGKHIVSSTEALNFEKVPEHLLVVGAGYIGLELGSVWARLGAKVTVLELLPRILPGMDAEIAGAVQKSLARQGLKFHLGTKVLGATVQGDQVVVRTQHDEKESEFQGDKVLVAVGRRPCTEGLGLKELGVATHERTGRVQVNESYQTSVPGIYAIGDLIDGPMLAHKAHEEGVAFAEKLAGKAAHVNYGAIPGVVYIWPEAATVGLSEEQVKEAGKPYRVGRFPFQASGRAIAMDETEGLAKVIADQATDRVLGVHIFGPRASDLIAEAVMALEFSASAEDIARICHAHPTLSEGLADAARAAYSGKAINLYLGR
ncbi:MAG: dihydrolipoyl dehydrogenase [Planctomycetia bacterium]|nr:dihydrolipoyl dehydrogenase [Planctomycetia bacterium]